MQPRESIHDRAIGRWRDILPRLNVSAQHLTGKHGPCPMCAGKDRFRFDDKDGRGMYICGQCGAGDGVSLVMKVNRWSFSEACRAIDELVGTARVVLPPKLDDASRYADDIWAAAKPLTGMDPASKYLNRRGISVLRNPPMLLRYTLRTTYHHEDKSKTTHPAMVARFVGPDNTAFATHVTYLTDAGHPAEVPKKRKFAPGKIPLGGAVRLAWSSETIGIAEGIETALSASQLDDVPVWAALNAGTMVKWQPPPKAKCIIVYGDNDQSFTGQASAYALAHRLVKDGYHVTVRIPEHEQSDWNDVAAEQSRALRSNQS